MQKLYCIVFLLLSNVSIAQNFDFYLDENGNAYYADSVLVLNQYKDSVFTRIYAWANTQVKSERDSLQFKVGLSSSIILNKTSSFKAGNGGIHSLAFTLKILLDDKSIRYTVAEIYHLDGNSGNYCNNLGNEMGSCEFEGDIEGWNRFRQQADSYFNRLLRQVQDRLSAK